MYVQGLPACVGYLVFFSDVTFFVYSRGPDFDFVNRSAPRYALASSNAVVMMVDHAYSRSIKIAGTRNC